jgi:hypothetical protein
MGGGEPPTRPKISGNCAIVGVGTIITIAKKIVPKSNFFIFPSFLHNFVFFFLITYKTFKKKKGLHGL